MTVDELTAAQIHYLLIVPKVFEDDWRQEMSAALFQPGRHELAVPESVELAGDEIRMSVLARRGPLKDDFSVMLRLHLDHVINLVRVNGPHPAQHVNRHNDSTVPMENSHVHYLTARYLALQSHRKPPVPEGFAIMIRRCCDIADALRVLAQRANISTMRPTLATVQIDARGALP